jgi:NAD(P)-dependent dehydrogenase (short-subunit alcohol dehydrogenase family)
LIVAGRSLSRLQASINELKSSYPDVDIRPLILDLSSQKAVRTAAAEVLLWSDVPVVDIVINSAGVMNLPERTLSEDGIEMHFATNHVGHFLFTNLIMSKLIAASQASGLKGAVRVINVSSLSPTVAGIRWSDMSFEKINKSLPADEQPNYGMLAQFGTTGAEEKSYVGLEGYNQSKVANVLYSIGLNARLYEKHGILSLAVHPGIIRTEISRYADEGTVSAVDAILKSGIYVKSLGAGASTSLVAAVDPKVELPMTRDGKENYGVYWVDCQVSPIAGPRAVSSENAEKLWRITERLVGESYAW